MLTEIENNFRQGFFKAECFDGCKCPSCNWVWIQSLSALMRRKFARYFDVEARIIPVSKESHYCLDTTKIRENLDENTIGRLSLITSHKQAFLSFLVLHTLDITNLSQKLRRSSINIKKRQASIFQSTSMVPVEPCSVLSQRQVSNSALRFLVSRVSIRILKQRHFWQ